MVVLYNPVNLNNQKKKKELHYFRRFNKVSSLLNNRYFTKSESPDFVSNDNRYPAIGVELTELTNSKKEIFSFEAKLVGKAKDVFLEKHELPLHVSFDFMKNIKISQSEINDTTAEMARVIWELVKDKKLTDYFSVSKEYPLPDYLRYVSADFFPGITDSVWYNNYAEFLPNVSVKDVQRIILQKEKKLKKYRENTDVVFLLIIEGMLPSWHDKINDVTNHKFNSSFDKVIIYRANENKVYELNIS